MKTEEIGVIKYGKLRFIFEMTEGVSQFLGENNIESQNLFPKTQFFYQGVLMKIGVNHEEEKNLNIIFHGIRFDEKKIIDLIEGDFEKFENFPMHIGEDIYFSEFVVKVEDRKK